MQGGRWFLKLGLGLLAAGLASGPVAAQVATVTVTTSPKSGTATASLTARAIVPDSCANLPPLYRFNFYWQTPNYPIWTTTVGCDRLVGGFDTRVSPKFAPPAPLNTIGPHPVLVNVWNTQSGSWVGSGTDVYAITGPP